MKRAGALFWKTPLFPLAFTGLTGERGAIPEATLQAMRDSGLAHLLAISGLHVGLVAGLLFFAVRALLALVPALALNPNLAAARFFLGETLLYSGRHKESIVELDAAIRLSPRDPDLWGILVDKAEAYMAMERYEEGLEFARASLRQLNAGVWAHMAEVVALAHLDRIEEARQALERVRAIKPDFDLDFVVSFIQQVRWVGPEFYLDGLKKAGLEE